MFAIIKTGGKQYHVKPNSCIRIEKIPGNVGDIVSFSEVLALVDQDKTFVGNPFLDSASVIAHVLEQGRSPSITIFKKRRRKNSRRKAGHRQFFTKLQISEILSGKEESQIKKAKPRPKAPLKEKAPRDKSSHS